MNDAVRPTIPDADGLIARLRQRDAEALTSAYRIAFGGEVGRFVLAHILAEAGVGQVRPRDMGGEARAWEDGRLATAITIMNRAGFDEASAAVTVLDESDYLKGRDDERSSDPAGYSGPDAAPWIAD